jgi:hypothetical protein
MIFKLVCHEGIRITGIGKGIAQRAMYKQFIYSDLKVAATIRKFDVINVIRHLS